MAQRAMQSPLHIPYVKKVRDYLWTYKEGFNTTNTMRHGDIQ